MSHPVNNDLNTLAKLYNDQSFRDGYSICFGSAYEVEPAIEYHNLFKKLSPSGQQALALSTMDENNIKALYSGKKPSYTEVSSQLPNDLLIPTYCIESAFYRLRDNKLNDANYLQKCNTTLMQISSSTPGNNQLKLVKS